jgi:outer membrane protein assembly factor BamB
LPAVVALLVGWWAYVTFIDKPPRPDAPSSTARSAAPGGWTTRDGDNSGARSTAAPAHVGGTETWRAALGSPAATALVADGELLVASLQDGRVVGLEATSGKTLWTATLSNPPLSPPVIAGDRVYVALRQGLLMVLNARDGTEVWRAPFAAGVYVEASPVVAGGVVYAYSSDGIFAFDAEDGRVLWEQPLAVRSAVVTPVIEGNHLVIVTVDKAIVFDRMTGEQTYYLTFSRTPPSSIAIRDGKIVVVYGRNVTAFEATSRRPWWDGLANISIGGGTVRGAWFRFYLYGMAPEVPPQEMLWTAVVPSRRTVAAAVGQGIAVVASPDGAVTALSLRDGTQVWTAKTGLLVAAPIITADGVLFTEEKRLVLLDATTGQQRTERKIDGLRGATPVGDATYASTSTGEVIALR